MRAPYDVREVIARIVDGSEFHEFKPLYGTTLVCGFARIWGMPVAILANNGVLFSRKRAEGRAFHRARLPAPHARCCSCRTSPASWSAANTRPSGIAKDGAKLVTAVATAQVPKITVLIGGSFGAGNYGMCGRAYSPALPVHLAQQPHQRDGRRAGGERARHRPPRRRQLDARSRPRPSRPPIRQRYEDEGNPYHATARLWDDGIIDPAQTRDVLGLAFAATLNAPIPERAFGVFRM